MDDPLVIFDWNTAYTSVCPSVTRVDQSKMVEVRIMQLSPQSSPTVSSWLTSPRNSKGNIWSRGAEEERVGKICNFQPISCRISETVQDRTRVSIKLLMTNTKSHNALSIGTKIDTLNYYRFKFSRNFALHCMFGRQQGEQRLNERR